MMLSTVFLFLFTSYSLVFLSLHIWLFSSLGLSFSFLGQQAREAGIDELYKQANETGIKAVFWCWWGHGESPIGHLFCLLAGAGSWIGVSEAHEEVL
jgi:hypothetical protein